MKLTENQIRQIVRNHLNELDIKTLQSASSHSGFDGDGCDIDQYNGKKYSREDSVASAILLIQDALTVYYKEHNNAQAYELLKQLGNIKKFLLRKDLQKQNFDDTLYSRLHNSEQMIKKLVQDKYHKSSLDDLDDNEWEEFTNLPEVQNNDFYREYYA